MINTFFRDTSPVAGSFQGLFDIRMTHKDIAVTGSSIEGAQNQQLFL